jgi:hypothetical protein
MIQNQSNGVKLKEHFIAIDSMVGAKDDDVDGELQGTAISVEVSASTTMATKK